MAAADGSELGRLGDEWLDELVMFGMNLWGSAWVDGVDVGAGAAGSWWMSTLGESVLISECLGVSVDIALAATTAASLAAIAAAVVAAETGMLGFAASPTVVSMAWVVPLPSCLTPARPSPSRDRSVGIS